MTMSSHNPVKHLWHVVKQQIHIMEVQSTDLQPNVMLSCQRGQISEERFQYLVQSMPRIINAFLKANSKKSVNKCIS